MSLYDCDACGKNSWTKNTITVRADDDDDFAVLPIGDWTICNACALKFSLTIKHHDRDDEGCQVCGDNGVPSASLYWEAPEEDDPTTGVEDVESVCAACIERVCAFMAAATARVPS